MALIQLTLKSTDTEKTKRGQCTEVRFASFLSGGFTTMAVINSLERKLVKRTSVHCLPAQNGICMKYLA